MAPVLAWQHVLERHPAPPHVEAARPSSGPLSSALLWERLLPKLPSRAPTFHSVHVRLTRHGAYHIAAVQMSTVSRAA